MFGQSRRPNAEHSEYNISYNNRVQIVVTSHAHVTSLGVYVAFVFVLDLATSEPQVGKAKIIGVNRILICEAITKVLKGDTGRYTKIAVNRITNLLRMVFRTYRLHDRLPTYAKRSMKNEVTYLSACTLIVPFKQQRFASLPVVLNGDDIARPHNLACCIWQYASLSFN